MHKTLRRAHCLIVNSKIFFLTGRTVIGRQFGIYSLRHRKCGVRGFIHELLGLGLGLGLGQKPSLARSSLVRVFDTNNEFVCF